MSSCDEGLHSSIICLYKLYIISPVPSEKVGDLKKEIFMKTEKKTHFNCNLQSYRTKTIPTFST